MVQILLTTTGTQDPVVLTDLGRREFAHPTTDFDLLTENFEYRIKGSSSLQSLLDAGHITMKYGTSVAITKVSEIESSERHAAYDCVVDVGGSADYTTIKAALDDGHKVIHVRNGTYVESGNLNLPDGCQLIGEAAGAVWIAFAGDFQIRADGHGGSVESTGTVSITHNTNVVTGVGTTFTNLVTDDYIVLDGTYYRINTLTNDTSLTLDENYRGKTISGEPYKAHAMFIAVKIVNISVVGGFTKDSIFMRGCYHAAIESSMIMNAGRDGYRFVDSGECALRAIVAQHCVGAGIAINGCNVIQLTASSFNNNDGSGICIENETRNAIFDGCMSTANKVNGIDVLSNSYRTTITDSIIVRNNGKGINTAGTTVTTIIDSCIIEDSGDAGVDFDGTGNLINDCRIANNAKHGVSAGDGGVISTSQIDNNANAGIRMGADNDCTVTGNRITNNTHEGIWCSGGRNEINGNLISDNGRDGIEVQPGGEDNIITGNQLRNNGHTGILIGSHNNIISANRVTLSGNEGINIEAGAADNIVTSNNAKGNIGTNIVDAGIGTEQANNKDVDFSPSPSPSAASPSISLSPSVSPSTSPSPSPAP
jgi:parallel beta-helix repeat protein